MHEMKSEMATTPNYQLNLPSLDDEADITKLNENFEKIDKVLKQNESDTTVTEKIEQINTKIGEPTDDHTKQTVFGKIAGVLKKVIGIRWVRHPIVQHNRQYLGKSKGLQAMFLVA